MSQRIPDAFTCPVMPVMIATFLFFGASLTVELTFAGPEHWAIFFNRLRFNLRRAHKPGAKWARMKLPVCLQCEYQHRDVRKPMTRERCPASARVRLAVPLAPRIHQPMSVDHVGADEDALLKRAEPSASLSFSNHSATKRMEVEDYFLFSPPRQL